MFFCQCTEVQYELCIMRFHLCVFLCISMQQRVQQGLEDGARLPCLDIEKLRGENNVLREEQQRLKKVCYCASVFLSLTASLGAPKLLLPGIMGANTVHCYTIVNRLSITGYKVTFCLSQIRKQLFILTPKPQNPKRHQCVHYVCVYIH